MFLVKDIYKYGDEGSLCSHLQDEHNFNGYTLTKEMTDAVKILTGAIRNSLEQEQGFKPLPTTEELLSKGDDKKR